MAHLEESSTILRFTRNLSLSCALETTQSVARFDANQIRTSKTKSCNWEQLSGSDVSLIEDLDGRQAV